MINQEESTFRRSIKRTRRPVLQQVGKRIHSQEVSRSGARCTGADDQRKASTTDVSAQDATYLRSLFYMVFENGFDLGYFLRFSPS